MGSLPTSRVTDVAYNVYMPGEGRETRHARIALRLLAKLQLLDSALSTFLLSFVNVAKAPLHGMRVRTQ
jgi:hypothetical protein